VIASLPDAVITGSNALAPSFFTISPEPVRRKLSSRIKRHRPRFRQMTGSL